jgi:hypothetical protein
MSVPSRLPSFLILLAVAAVAACDTGGRGDARTAFVSPGISRDSMLTILKAPLAGLPVPPAGSDSLGNVWRITRYVAAAQEVEIVWYSATNEKHNANDTIPEGDVTPIVIQGNKVVGVGRRTYDSVARVLKLPRNRY